MFIYLGKMGNDLGPVAVMTAYLAIRGRAPGQFKSRVPLSHELLVKHLRELMSANMQGTVSTLGCNHCSSSVGGGLDDEDIGLLAEFSLPDIR